MEKQKPISKHRVGSVVASVWRNEVLVKDRTVPMLKVSIERRYKSKDGEWKSSGSFSRNEIPLAQYVLGKAFEAMIEDKSGEEESD